MVGEKKGKMGDTGMATKMVAAWSAADLHYKLVTTCWKCNIDCYFNIVPYHQREEVKVRVVTVMTIWSHQLPKVPMYHLKVEAALRDYR